MSDMISVAIVGTGQHSDPSQELTHGPADDLVARMPSPDRERAFLLRAGAHAVLRRGSRIAGKREASLSPAPADVLPPCGPRLTELLTTLLSEDQHDLVVEALERMTKRGMRLSPELLPLALRQTKPELRAQLRPVLGARGVWLGAQRPEWSWAREASATDEALPPDFDQRWADGTAGERRALLRLARRLSDDRGRGLVSASWKQEKAEQRLAWLEELEMGVSSDDEALLTSMLGDRSSQVRVAAARLCWKIPGSAIALRVRERVTSLLSFQPPKGGLLGKLKAALSSGPGAFEVSLPPETYDPEWEREGILENPQLKIGRRQWWLQQMVSAVPPNHWAQHFDTTPPAFVDAVLPHDMAGVLLDGFTQAALLHGGSGWIAALWDGWMRSKVAPTTPGALSRLAERLSPDDAEERGLALAEREGGATLLASFPRPWSPRLSKLVLSRLGQVQPEWSELLRFAALAIPVDLLPEAVPTLDVAENDYLGRAHLRALERFQTVSGLRRSIARETPL
jgi:hypothetical protein